MSDQNDFSDIVDSKIGKLNESLNSLRANIKDPQYHSARVRETIQSALQELSQMDEKMHMTELIGIVNQIPEYVASAWTEAANTERAVIAQLVVWKDVQKEYTEFLPDPAPDPEPELTQKLKTAPIDDAFLEAVRVGDIKEPTRMSSIRREVGTRPESLRKVRNAKEIIKNSPEQK